MSLKLDLVERFQKAGYDFVTACEEVQNCINRFNESCESVMRFKIRSINGIGFVDFFELRRAK